MMKNQILFLIFCFSLFFYGCKKQVDKFKPDFSSPIKYNNYNLVWNDEFNDSGSPDALKWDYEHGFVRNKELQWYQKDNANCKEGVLLIEAKREVIKNNLYDSTSTNWRRNREFADYSSSCLITKEKHSWKYGRFEIRARIDSTKGSWPAIWTLGEHGKWPNNGEIDLMEFYIKNGSQSILANAATGGEEQYSIKWDSEVIPLNYFLKKDSKWVEQFHIWRMDWHEEEIKLFLDNELLNTISIDDEVNREGVVPFKQKHYLLLNLAIGSNGGNPLNSNFPITYEIDYVRIYQKTN